MQKRNEVENMATLDDIAKELGVAKSTVSKALNGAKDVSGAMRQAVLEKAVEMGYSRLPRSSNPLRIALFITNMEYTKPDDFGYDLVAGFRKAAEPAGFCVEIIPLTMQLQEEISYDAFMVRENYCGGLFLGLDISQDPWMVEMENCKTPTVLYDNHVSTNSNVTYIGTNNQEGMELAVKYLKSLGHTKIGYLTYELHSYIYQRRYYAFSQAMAENGLDFDSSMSGSARHVSECLNLHLPKLLAQGCTAIVCSHDFLAHSVMVHCQELGLSVPENVSILGFDDIPLCRYTVPPLTTIRQDRMNLGKSALYALTSQMNHVCVSSLLLHAELVVRGSCGPVSE